MVKWNALSIEAHGLWPLVFAEFLPGLSRYLKDQNSSHLLSLDLNLGVKYNTKGKIDLEMRPKKLVNRDKPLNI